jgi:hypothetical protein
MDSDARTLVGGRGIWSSTPWNYSSLRYLQFNENGSGTLTYGYGQTIYAVIQCRWEILPPGRLSLTYLESPGHSHLFFKGFTPDPHQNVRDLSYKLTEGVVSGVEDIVAMPFQFRWTLELSEPPWPSSLKLPYEAPRVFYGHRQSDKPRSGQSS